MGLLQMASQLWEEFPLPLVLVFFQRCLPGSDHQQAAPHQEPGSSVRVPFA